MSKQSHLIIGSNSFLGHSVSKILHANGDQVLGVYNKNKAHLFSEINHIHIASLKSLANDFDCVYIISAFVPNKHSNNITQKLQEVNIELVDTICKQFKKAKIIFCSSVSVYKENQGVIDEHSIIEPVSDYGISKVTGESIVKKSKAYAIVRIASMFGVHMSQTTFLPVIMKQAIEQKEITLFGEGNRVQNYIHVDDVANYLIGAGQYKTNGTFLATAKQSISNRTLAETIKTLVPETKIVYKGIDESKSYLYDNSETRSKLNITEEKELKIELQKIIEWMRKES